MIGSEREALIDRVANDDPPHRLGGPLAMFGLLLLVWVTGRFALWESPFPGSGLIADATVMLAQESSSPARSSQVPLATDESPARHGSWPEFAQRLWEEPRMASGAGVGAGAGLGPATGAPDKDVGPAPAYHDPAVRLARSHMALWRAALVSDTRGASWRARRSQLESARAGQADTPVFPGRPSFAAPSDDAKKGRTNRWTLDAWAFLREGSGSAPIAQGRVPVYGASQVGANLQFRVAPGSSRDPRLFARAYRALLDEPESELAAGISVRPVPAIPVRVAAEVRLTDDRFRSDVRPAAYAITEIPPIPLPLDVSGEVYAGAGYVGGAADTAFIDGQATLVRRVASFDLAREDDVRLSFGAGAWGGAQRDANRLDLGPTMRVDMSLGAVPARISIDYRERVGGDASPVSGVAATVSTRF